jgi:hypothetical protein
VLGRIATTAQVLVGFNAGAVTAWFITLTRDSVEERDLYLDSDQIG